MAVSTVVSKTATGQSAAIPMDYHCTGTSPMGLALDFTTTTAVGTASVEFTFSENDLIAAGTAVWLPITSLSGKTATTVVAETLPARAVRLNVTAYTSGTIYLRVLQGNAE